MFSTYTISTCSDACWYAREETCRCSCAGANHGILLKQGRERPKRTRRVKGHWFELHAIIPGHRAAQDEAAKLLAAAGEIRKWHTTIRPEWGSPPLYAIDGPTDKQLETWPELKSFRDWRSKGRCYAEAAPHRPHLVWARMTRPTP